MLCSIYCKNNGSIYIDKKQIGCWVKGSFWLFSTQQVQRDGLIWFLVCFFFFKNVISIVISVPPGSQNVNIYEKNIQLKKYSNDYITHTVDL